MSEPYLILHKVRGEPAFDVAIQMTCPLCNRQGCYECESEGYWWIVSTSGHRAYPALYWKVDDLIDGSDPARFEDKSLIANLPDHYRVNKVEAPKEANASTKLLHELGLVRKLDLSRFR